MRERRYGEDGEAERDGADAGTGAQDRPIDEAVRVIVLVVVATVVIAVVVPRVVDEPKWPRIDRLVRFGVLAEKLCRRLRGDGSRGQGSPHDAAQSSAAGRPLELRGGLDETPRSGQRSRRFR